MSTNQLYFARSILEIYEARSLSFLYSTQIRAATLNLNPLELGRLTACMIADLDLRGMDVKRFAAKWLQLFNA
jgi:hypothetical protein